MAPWSLRKNDLSVDLSTLPPFEALIADRTGLRIRPQDQATLMDSIQERIRTLELEEATAYLVHLEQTPIQSQEWELLCSRITNGESYFFRDAGQFKLLREELFPRLIQHRRAQVQAGKLKRPYLRLWSAGCSGGEEPYSLAIALQECLPDIDAWDIFILGSDINPQALEKAKAGFYKRWSFRQTNYQSQSAYFRSTEKGWQVVPKLRQRMTWEHLNLVAGPQSHQAFFQSMDLIICRNVFIYFEREAIATVLGHFHRCLSPQGYLMAGHAELEGQDLSAFHGLHFPQSMVYQRSDAKGMDKGLPLGTFHKDVQPHADHTLVRFTSPSPLPPPVPMQPLAPISMTVPMKVTPAPTMESVVPLLVPLVAQPSPLSPQEDAIGQQTEFLGACAELEQYESLLAAGQYQALQKQLAGLPNSALDTYEIAWLMARMFANQGLYAQAQAYAERALNVESNAIAPLFLLAQMAELQDQRQQAKDYLRKILYLAPENIMAHLELAAIYETEGDRFRYTKLLRTAQELLAQLPADGEIEFHRPISVRQLLKQISQKIR
jgi:chemotaxis protein methyltransferase CheR